VNNDGVDDFIMIDAILQNEGGGAPSPSDIQRWAEGDIPAMGVNGWASGNLNFPVVSDGDAAIWLQYYLDGRGALPTNLIIGADFVLDFFESGWQEDPSRCCIEKNLCELMPPGFVIPSTGTNCDQVFDCQFWDNGMGAYRPVCTD
jgi:hypothetical protein